MKSKLLAIGIAVLIITSSTLPNVAKAYTQDDVEKVRTLMQDVYPEITDDEIIYNLEIAEGTQVTQEEATEENIEVDQNLTTYEETTEGLLTNTKSSTYPTITVEENNCVLCGYREPSRFDEEHIVWAPFVAGILTGVVTSLIAYHLTPDRSAINMIGDAIHNNRYVKNGWIDLKYKGMWMYKKNGEYVRNYWVQGSDGSWYYLKEDRLMMDKRFDNDGWLVARSSNGSYKTRWFEFAEGGKLLKHQGWRTWGSRWLYHVPGNYGAARNEILNINNEYFRFDSGGYCISGRGCY